MSTPLPAALDELSDPFAAHLRGRGAARRTILAHVDGLRRFALFYEQSQGTWPKTATR